MVCCSLGYVCASENLLSILFIDNCTRINMVVTIMELAYHVNCHQGTTCDWEGKKLRLSILTGLYAGTIFRWLLCYFVRNQNTYPSIMECWNLQGVLKMWDACDIVLPWNYQVDQMETNKNGTSLRPLLTAAIARDYSQCINLRDEQLLYVPDPRQWLQWGHESAIWVLLIMLLNGRLVYRPQPSSPGFPTITKG